MTSEEAHGAALASAAPAAAPPQTGPGEAGPSTHDDHGANGAAPTTTPATTTAPPSHIVDVEMTEAGEDMEEQHKGGGGGAVDDVPPTVVDVDGAKTAPQGATAPSAAPPASTSAAPITTTLSTRVSGTAIHTTQQVAPIPPFPIPPKDCNFEERKRHRDRIRQLPFGKFFECTGRPTMVWEVADYTEAGAGLARSEIPFLFKAFETGQIGPARMKAKYGDARAHTIHEYLDWTMIAQPPTPENDLDFTGFRVVMVLPRYRSQWPPPGLVEEPVAREHTHLGAPLDPVPQLVVGGKAVTAATIRCGPNYIEVPFVATHETRRGKGWGRACVEAIEDIARYLQLPYLLLCSTNDAATKSTWQHLGFVISTDEDLARMQVDMDWLLHMDNTVQMHKHVLPLKRWRSIIVKHDSLRRRVYVSEDELEKAKKAYDDGSMFKRPPLPAPPKKGPIKASLPRKRKASINGLSTTPRYSSKGPGFGGAFSESTEGGMY